MKPLLGHVHLGRAGYESNENGVVLHSNAATRPSRGDDFLGDLRELLRIRLRIDRAIDLRGQSTGCEPLVHAVGKSGEHGSLWAEQLDVDEDGRSLEEPIEFDRLRDVTPVKRRRGNVVRRTEGQSSLSKEPVRVRLADRANLTADDATQPCLYPILAVCQRCLDREVEEPWILSQLSSHEAGDGPRVWPRLRDEPSEAVIPGGGGIPQVQAGRV